MKYTGKIIALAFPETFVRFSDEKISRFLPWFGLGKNGVIKAGHAAFVLINNKTGFASYYDFGRYITPQGYGRVRSAVTDVELEIPFKADISEKGELTNLDRFLLWLEANPQKTHGSGRLIASVCDFVDYEKANSFILAEQARGSIPYRTFTREGSNCSRIVTDTILASTDKTEIRRPLLRNRMFTPSPLGNVEKASLENDSFQVEDGIIKKYDKSALWTTLQNVYLRRVPNLDQNRIYKTQEHLKNAQLLTGVGSSAYFKINDCYENELFEISRFNEEGEEDFRGVFKTERKLNIQNPYQFIYDSHCKYCHIKQGERIVRLTQIEKINIVEFQKEEINLRKMVRLV